MVVERNAWLRKLFHPQLYVADLEKYNIRPGAYVRLSANGNWVFYRFWNVPNFSLAKSLMVGTLEYKKEMRKTSLETVSPLEKARIDFSEKMLRLVFYTKAKHVEKYFNEPDSKNFTQR